MRQTTHVPYPRARYLGLPKTTLETTRRRSDQPLRHDAWLTGKPSTDPNPPTYTDLPPRRLNSKISQRVQSPNKTHRQRGARTAR